MAGTDRVDVIVVGAGLAGLCAAWRLHTAGRRVFVLEASSEICGRTRSRCDAVGGTTRELGAEFVGGNHVRWLTYADLFGIALEEIAWPAFECIEIGGESYRDAELRQLLTEFEVLRLQMTEQAARVQRRVPWDLPNAEHLDRTSLAAGIESLEGTSRAKALMKSRFEYSESGPAEQISWLGQLLVIQGHGNAAYWEETERYRVPDGVETLGRQFASRLPTDAIMTDAAVSTIAHDASGTEAATSDGRRFAADWLVLCVPAGQWNRIRIEPSLPATLSLGMGKATKEFVRLERLAGAPANVPLARFVDPPGFLWPAGGGADVVRFVSGPAAEAHRAKTVERRREEFEDLLARSTHLAGRRQHDYLYQDWTAEPWIGGSYSYASLGKAVGAGPVLDSGIGRLAFAGEHCSLNFTGYMEGALETAESAVRRILMYSGPARSSFQGIG